MCAYAPYDCDNVALWWVTHHNTNRTLHVCSDHRDARLFDGWTVTDRPPLRHMLQAAADAKQSGVR